MRLQAAIAVAVAVIPALTIKYLQQLQKQQEQLYIYRTYVRVYVAPAL